MKIYKPICNEAEIYRTEPLEEWVKDTSGWRALVEQGLVEDAWTEEGIHMTARYHFVKNWRDSPDLIEFDDGFVVADPDFDRTTWR